MRSIEILSHHLINQIKAGEVIERPAQALKELIENSLDAQASKIQCEIKNNALEFLQIIDNGHGITFKDLPNAFSRHGTSKISQYDDLQNLYSYGFRGEALPSISSVSQVECITQTDSEEYASLFELKGNEILFHSKIPAQKNPGTAITIKNLFFNTPVRLEFLESKNSELSSIKKVMHSFVLARPDVSFEWRMDEQEKTLYPECLNENDFKERICALFKINSINHLIEIKTEYEDKNLSLYFPLNISSKSRPQQFLIINKRPIQDKKIISLIAKTIQKKYHLFDAPHFVLYLNIPANQLDINVHPTKSMVKFHQNAKILGFILSSIQNNNEKKNSTHFIEKENVFLSPMAPHESFSSANSYLPEKKEESLAHFWQENNEFALYRDNSFFYGIKLKKLQNEVLENYFKNESTHDQIIPLFVSTPIQIKNPNQEGFKWLAQNGFIIEQLNNGPYVIREIPRFFLQTNYSVFVAYILEFFQENFISQIPLILYPVHIKKIVHESIQKNDSGAIKKILLSDLEDLCF